eukprot:scaffold707_cov240-Pinguiococcus_pyrenoidosus.AAC.6
MRTGYHIELVLHHRCPAEEENRGRERMNHRSQPKGRLPRQVTYHTFFSSVTKGSGTGAVRSSAAACAWAATVGGCSETAAVRRATSLQRSSSVAAMPRISPESIGGFQNHRDRGGDPSHKQWRARNSGVTRPEPQPYPPVASCSTSPQVRTASGPLARVGPPELFGTLLGSEDEGGALPGGMRHQGGLWRRRCGDFEGPERKGYGGFLNIRFNIVE